MRLETNTTISVGASNLTSIPKAFRAVKKLIPELSIAEYQSRLKTGGALIEIPTYRNDMSEYLDGLATAIEVLRELNSQADHLKLSASDMGAVSLGDLEETLAFHQGYQPVDLVGNTSGFLKRYEEADWQAHTGGPIDHPDVVGVAVPPKDDQGWGYIQIGIQTNLVNQLVSQVGYHHAFLHTHFDQLMPAISRLVQSKLSSTPPGYFDTHNEPSGLIMLACIERYFSNQIDSMIATSWTEWLFRGRIPCGWQGEYPEGQLLVW